ncbi:hypothetical protein DY000_02021512 [Brassica cretica]|uniref:DUF4005 domain-containing protein n=1 Tax=Brassica cretica TaxID=69181 RepID=A0ABQ7E2T5_BRACR|nr:hypothetical protein DY000_02021512 [Brassica cretica]
MDGETTRPSKHPGPSTKLAPASGPASMHHAQVHKPPLRESPKLQAPPSPRYRPRAYASSTRHQRFKKDSARLRSVIREPVLPRVQSYSPSSMTKSSNMGQTVGEKYSGIKFLQTPGRTLASGSPLGSTPGPVPGRTPSSGEKENFR